MRELAIPASERDQLDWFRRGICYQIFPDRFAREDDGQVWELDEWGAEPTRTNYMGGNLRGITSRLGYLKSLGVSSIYTTPIFEAPANHRYDTSDYLKLAPMVGNEADLRDLTHTASAQGIRLILDGVFNHVGETFPPFIAAKAGDPSARAMFHFHQGTNDYQTVGGAQFMPKLNHEDARVLDLVDAVLRKWDDFGIGGWRLDVPWKVPASFWQLVRHRATDLQASQLWIAEAWAQWAFADGFESIMNYHSRNRLLDLVHLHHADAEDFFTDLAQWTSTWKDPSLILNAVGSHDTQRIMNACAGSRRDALMVLALNALIPGVAMLYYGDELGMPGDNDPGCRGAFPVEPDASQLQFRQALLPVLQLRAEHRALSHGSLSVQGLRNHAFVFTREFGDCRISVAGNSGDRPEPFSVSSSVGWLPVVGEQPAESAGILLAPRSLSVQVDSGCGCRNF